MERGQCRLDPRGYCATQNGCDANPFSKLGSIKKKVFTTIYVKDMLNYISLNKALYSEYTDLNSWLV